MLHAEETARKPCAVVDIEIDEASHGRSHSRISGGRQAPTAARRNNRMTDARNGQVYCAHLRDWMDRERFGDSHGQLRREG